MKLFFKLVSRCASCALLAAVIQADARPARDVAPAGIVVECQGICSFRPRMRQRWSPITGGMHLQSGDRIRAASQGANAIRVRLAGGDEFILGPGGLIELTGDGQVKLIRGDLEASPSPGEPMTVDAGGEAPFEIKERQLLRSRDGGVSRPPSDPAWLRSLRGILITESMGSLLANVAGRDVPLKIASHKLSVDIHDQIARTVIEASFANHTESTLDGVFSFPLPHDASVSGFAMWIGDECIVADVVEKQGPRETNETLLRKRGDPGSLVWRRKNVFKASVSAIAGHAEKRIQISYTQVLPMEAGGYRYTHALQSKMLEQASLPELRIDLRIHSAMPLEGVVCSSHETRIDSSTHSAHVEFSAQKYTPNRDFEVSIALADEGNQITMIPELRGEDGYFQLLLFAPGDRRQWERARVVDGPGVDLLIVADTSASMSPAQREAQDRFLGILLLSLGEHDRFRLAAVDVDCNWYEGAQEIAVSDTTIAGARSYVSSRASLGWTDLGKAFKEVLEKAGDKTHVVYIGDGIDTTKDADPVAIAKVLKHAYKGRGTVHAVATGSYEPRSLNALASLGGGSFRFLTSVDTAQRMASALLSEILQPGIRDLVVDFEGVRVARVYPDALSDLAAGSQQILFGRYLSVGRDQVGKVTVSGTRHGEEIRFGKRVLFKDAESGNTLISGLWAQRHLDWLLAQKQSPEIRAEIIGLSEAYHLSTPYTSFRVLERDEDREHFKVKRRFQISDNDRFFGQRLGEEAFTVRQKQMRLAREWRMDLLHDMMHTLSRIGRMPPVPGAESRIDRLSDQESTFSEAVAIEQGHSGDRHVYPGEAQTSDADEALDPDAIVLLRQQYRLLVALDNPEAFEETLRSWIGPEDADSAWRVALGYLMAERNRINEAIQIFESIEALDALPVTELRRLADWYLVVGRDKAHHAARMRALMEEDEEVLRDRLQVIFQPWFSRGVKLPDELDPEAFRIFTTLFKKSQNPTRHVSQLQAFYRYTNDNRLLESLVDGVIGLGPQQVYPLVTRLEYLFREMRDEASVDSIVEYLESVRKHTLTATDERTLDILEMQVERRAAELGNREKMHGDAAFAAMQRAFLGTWGVGEPRLMGHLLASLGRIGLVRLQDAQLRQLRVLNALEGQSQEDALALAISLGDTLMTYDEPAEAIEVIESALRAYRERNDGKLGPAANGAFARLVSYLSRSKQHSRAERVVMGAMKRSKVPVQKYWMKLKLFEVYIEAIKAKASVSIGSGQVLFPAVLDLFREACNPGDPSQRRQLVQLLSAFIRYSHDSGLGLEGIRKYTLEDFTAFLASEDESEQYHRMAGILADALHDSGRAVLALEFMVAVLENESDRAGMLNPSGWRFHANRLAMGRKATTPGSSLDQRLLELARGALHRDLKTRTEQGRQVYAPGGDFWAEKNDEFLAVANAVWAEDKPAAAAARHISLYLFHDLHAYNRAIEILLEAAGEGGLDDLGRGQLVEFLDDRSRFDEIIPFAEGLVRRQPDFMKHRVMLMRAYFKESQTEKLKDALASADTHYHKRDLWNETNVAALAESCLDNRLLEEAVVYYENVIALRKRNKPMLSGGDGVLASYYKGLSHAYICLLQTAAAVEAASGVIVSWGTDAVNRKSAVNGLQRVLAQAPGLDGYVASLDKRTKESGLENPTVRQALGWVYLQKRKFKRSARQLDLAIASQPYDRRSHELRLKVYEKAIDLRGVIHALREWIMYFPHEPELYESLGRRLAQAGFVKESERALASMVEMMVNESESHARLAGIRERQGRWEDAMHHWQRIIRIRSDEPTGYLNLARLQVRQKQWAAARENCRMVLQASWPDRFRNAHAEAEQLLRQMPAEDAVRPGRD